MTGTRLVVVVGPGGVGKTTVAAATALELAHSADTRVLVLTADPARRLADVLGLADAADSRVAVDGPGELWASTLDPAQVWDDLVRAEVGDEAEAEAIIANAVYRNITRRFVGASDYAATQRLAEVAASGRYDVVVLDTPPSRRAVDLLHAPERTVDFFSSRFLTWLTAVPSTAMKPLNFLGGRLLGQGFLGELQAFFALFDRLSPRLRERGAEVDRLLHSDDASFVVVASPRSGPRRQAAAIAAQLRRDGFPVRLEVVNRRLPAVFRDAGVTARADELADGANPLLAAAALAYADLAEPVDQSSVEAAIEIPHLGRAVDDRSDLRTIGARIVAGLTPG